MVNILSVRITVVLAHATAEYPLRQWLFSDVPQRAGAFIGIAQPSRRHVLSRNGSRRFDTIQTRRPFSFQHKINSRRRPFIADAAGIDLRRAVI